MSKSLTVAHQEEVVFYGDSLTAVRAEDGKVYASIRHMCDALGLNARGQNQRIDRHTVLSRGKGVCKIHTPGGAQSTTVLRVDLVPLWLTGLQTSKVDDSVREKLEKFQEEAATVLWEALQEKRLTADPSFDELLNSGSEAAEAYKILQAMLKLARNQLMLETQLNSHKTQLDNHEQRLEEIETSLTDDKRNVTPEQASQISQAVKTVAMTMGKQTKRNEFGAVYGELYRRFGITSYKLLPARRFDEAMTFLTNWHEELTSGLPF